MGKVVLGVMVAVVATVGCSADRGDDDPASPDAAIDAPRCPAISCGGVCVDPLTDERHCGAAAGCIGGIACGVETRPGDTCEQGVCVGSRQLVVNGGFDTGLTGWQTANNPAMPGSFSDPVVVFGWMAPGYASGGSSRGPAARQLYQDFRVPMRPSAATFSFEHFQAGFDVSQDLDPEDVLTIEKDPLNEGGDTPDNAYRIDLVDPAGPLFYEPILYPVHSPDALPIGAMGALVPVTNDRPDLLVFLAAHQGQMIRLRIGHVESTFPWQNGIDDVSLVVVSQ